MPVIDRRSFAVYEVRISTTPRLEFQQLRVHGSERRILESCHAGEYAHEDAFSVDYWDSNENYILLRGRVFEYVGKCRSKSLADLFELRGYGKEFAFPLWGGGLRGDGYAVVVVDDEGAVEDVEIPPGFFERNGYAVRCHGTHLVVSRSEFESPAVVTQSF